MSYIINIKKTKNTQFNKGVRYVGTKLIKFDGSDRDKANMLSVARAYSKTLLGRSVPVNYDTSITKDGIKTDGSKSYTDGKKIVISGEIIAENLDSTIGLVLHESSHIAITDFNTWDSTKTKVKERGFDEKYTDYCFNLLNWVEDRRIDNWAYNKAPGLVKYYEALYWRYFLPEETSNLIKETKSRGVKKTISSYLFFIINMINDDVKCDELPDLDKISKLIDLDNIDRLKNTKECQDIALDIFKIILDNIDPEEQQDEDERSNVNNQCLSSELDLSKLSDEEIQDLIKKSLDNHGKLTSGEMLDDGLTIKIEPETAERVNKLLDDMDVSKTINENDKEAKKPKYKEDVYDAKTSRSETIEKVIVKTKINYNYIKTGQGNIYTSTPSNEINRAYNIGLCKSRLLSKKIRIREEIRERKVVRQKRGKIDGRTLYTGAYTKDEMFFKSLISKYDNTNVHISVDASGSMHGEKWEKTIILLTTLAYGFIKIDNLRLQISFRYSLGYDKGNIVDVFYDSQFDKLSKLECLPNVKPSGGTPEGICFKGMNKKVMLPLLNKNTLFVNISDGEPNSVFAETCTKETIDYYKKLGMGVLSYFITSGFSDNSWNTFLEMYGEKNSTKLDVKNIYEIAKSINNKLLEFGKK